MLSHAISISVVDHGYFLLGPSCTGVNKSTENICPDTILSPEFKMSMAKSILSIYNMLLVVFIPEKFVAFISMENLSSINHKI